MRSLRFITLYVCVALALFLNFTRDRWGDQPWFLIVAGVTGGTTIYVLRSMLTRQVTAKTTRGHSSRLALFGFLAVACFVAGGFLLQVDKLLSLAMLGMSGLFIYALLGTLNRWPGFRETAKPNTCPHCRYDLTGNISGVCPECGTSLT